MAHSTVVAIVAVVVIIGCLAAGWCAEEIRVRRERRREHLNTDDVDAYVEDQGGWDGR